MKSLYQDGKAVIMKKVGIICLLLCAVLLLSGMLWGQQIASLLQGPQRLEQFEYELRNEDSTKHIYHAYVEKNIELITGSYAQYGEMKEGEMNNQTVYYLMPLNDKADYFVTILAYGDVVTSLDEMETLFYDSIGSEQKKYHDPVAIQGGFKKLNEEELTYALDYFSAYDSKIKNTEDLKNVLSPYAIVVNQIGSVEITSLWLLWYGWIGIVICMLLCALLYGTKVFMRPLKKDINALTDNLKDILDEDYTKAKEYQNLKLGSKLLYLKDTWSMHVYDYRQFIWIYHKEIRGKKKRCFEICAYDKNGRQYHLWQGEDQKKAAKICQIIFHHCEQALMGFESNLYEVWKKHPEQLYDRCMEMFHLQHKIKQEEDQELMEKQRKKKKNKKRKSKNKNNK